MDNQSIIKTHVQKPEKFRGSDFRRWQLKMLFNLTTFMLPKWISIKGLWSIGNPMNIRTYILNALDDFLYDILSCFATVRQTWESLANKYKTQWFYQLCFYLPSQLRLRLSKSFQEVWVTKDYHTLVRYIVPLEKDIACSIYPDLLKSKLIVTNIVSKNVIIDRLN